MKTIKIDLLARVEGEGALTVKFKDGAVREVQLRIFEPPRFFEALLRGRAAIEAPDITARICGICPVAYQVSSCAAIENAFGIELTSAIRDLRKLIYCGEWIESHALHVFMLHAPDFLGYADAIAMASEHRDLLARGLRIKKAGNALIRVIGGREVHPVNLRVGGFYRAPSTDELAVLLPELRSARNDTLAALDWISGFQFPAFSRDYELVAIRGGGDYPFMGSRIASNKGMDIDVREFDDHFVEHQLPYSNALHAMVKGRGAYLCGPIARFNLNFDSLSPTAKDAAHRAGLQVPCTNPFKSILVRTVEMIHALDESIRLIENYRPPSPPFLEHTPRAAIGFGCSEAPRGILYHRYQIDGRGMLIDAKIIPPTSQNQKTMEEDIAALAPAMLSASRREAAAMAERAIRNHDPCISCATHFLDLTIERE